MLVITFGNLVQLPSYKGMAADIYKEYAAAREVIEECDAALGGGLKDIMFEGPQVKFNLSFHLL